MAPRRALPRSHRPLLLVQRPQPPTLQHHHQGPVIRSSHSRPMGRGYYGIYTLLCVRHRLRRTQHIQEDAAGHWSWQYVFQLVCHARQRDQKSNSFIIARTWTSNISSKTRSMLWSKTDSVAGTFDDTTRNNSVALGSMQRLRSHTTETPDLEQQPASSPSFFARIFRCETPQQLVLPHFEHRSRPLAETIDTDIHKSKTREQSPGASAYAWATNRSDSERENKGDGVHVMR
jgi:hypothetical protein